MDREHDVVADAYRRMGHLVRARCVRILRDHAAADDALQEVFVRTWRFLSAYQRADSKLGWLYRLADRCSFDVLARRKSRGEVNETVARSTGPSSALEDREIVLAFLHRFDERVQQVAVLHYLDEMTQDEIATATGWSRQTVVKKLALLRERADALRPLYLGSPS